MRERPNRFAGAINALKERLGASAEKLVVAVADAIVGNELAEGPKELPRHLDYGNYKSSQLSPEDLMKRRWHEREIADRLFGTKWRESRAGSEQ